MTSLVAAGIKQKLGWKFGT